jgi:signal transduction histidine kinase
VSHTLVVLADLRRALRQEERQAWQRLVRVLSHEINNSLAPIHSIASSLQELLQAHTAGGDWVADVRDGLAVVQRRSAALSRFMAAYAQLARLPAPRLGPVELETLVRRIAALEQRLPVKVAAGPPIHVRADADQLEQLLINLVRNAADAALETGGAVEVSWRQNGATAEILVADEGPGLVDSANLFVPFFTTKPQGSGIGLVLSRQIAEAHSGSLTLRNAVGGRGCNALLCLPVQTVS